MARDCWGESIKVVEGEGSTMAAALRDLADWLEDNPDFYINSATVGHSFEDNAYYVTAYVGV